MFHSRSMFGSSRIAKTERTASAPDTPVGGGLGTPKAIRRQWKLVVESSESARALWACGTFIPARHHITVSTLNTDV